MRRSRTRHDEEAEINITPMLDIVFIMLIFFIVTTSFVREFGVDISRPDNTPPKDKKISEVIAVRISELGDVSVDNRDTDIGRVRALIESGLASKPEASVVVIANRAADAGILVTVIDGARSAGASKVSLAEDAT
ncbi:MAG: ExbD/TolR family protein [Gammaproteobacteria bacterium]